MGVNTDALLIYGYIWDDEVELSELLDHDDQSSWEKIVAKKRGHVDPWDAMPALGDEGYEARRAAQNEWIEANSSAIDAFRDVEKAIRAEYGCELDWHGADDWRCPIVKIASAGFVVGPWEASPVVASNLDIDPSWDAKLAQFCADLEIDTSEARGPGWFLCSWWA